MTMPFPPPSSSSKIIHLKMNYLKMAPQEMEDFNPIYFFTILKRSLINLHILLTKCPNSTYYALESYDGRNSSKVT